MRVDKARAEELEAIMCHQLDDGSEVMLVPLIFSAAIRRGRQEDYGWRDQW